jgi:hypothetical protein
MKIKYFIFILLLTLTLINCTNDNSGDYTLVSENKNKSLSDHSIKAKKVLDDAINSLNNIAEEFHWRDTHLIIQESQTALLEGQYVLSIELAEKVIHQSKLMKEQQEYAKNNWQSLVPKKEKK